METFLVIFSAIGVCALLFGLGLFIVNLQQLFERVRSLEETVYKIQYGDNVTFSTKD